MTLMEMFCSNGIVVCSPGMRIEHFTKSGPKVVYDKRTDGSFNFGRVEMCDYINMQWYADWDIQHISIDGDTTVFEVTTPEDWED